jgi:hypothetical protein
MELKADKLAQMRKDKRAQVEREWVRCMNLDLSKHLEAFREMAKHYSYEELARPFIVRDMRKRTNTGRRVYSIRRLMKKYAVGERCIRRIGVEVGIYRS